MSGVARQFEPSVDSRGVTPDDWMQQALCAQTDPEAFFPEKGGSTRAAKRICAVCPVAGQCLAYALAHEHRFGIWGGMSERERRRLRAGSPRPVRVPAVRGRKGCMLCGGVKPAGHGVKLCDGCARRRAS